LLFLVSYEAFAFAQVARLSGGDASFLEQVGQVGRYGVGVGVLAFACSVSLGDRFGDALGTTAGVHPFEGLSVKAGGDDAIAHLSACFRAGDTAGAFAVFAYGVGGGFDHLGGGVLGFIA
jgi:hypothetical protein